MEEVAGKFQLDTVALVAGERRPREKILVDLHGTVGLAATAEKVAQGDVGLDGVAVDLEGTDEGLDGPILLIVEQVVEPHEVIPGQSGRRSRRAGASAFAAAQPPSDGDRCQQQG